MHVVVEEEFGVIMIVNVFPAIIQRQLNIHQRKIVYRARIGIGQEQMNHRERVIYVPRGKNPMPMGRRVNKIKRIKD